MVKNIGQIQQPALPQTTGQSRTERTGGADFQGFLDSNLKLSKHVSQRIDRRQLELGPDRIKALEGAVDKAAAKGAKESLVLLDDLALLVSVKNRTVITAMDKNNMKEGVFTQIDSAVIA